MGLIVPVNLPCRNKQLHGYRKNIYFIPDLWRCSPPFCIILFLYQSLLSYCSGYHPACLTRKKPDCASSDKNNPTTFTFHLCIFSVTFYRSVFSTVFPFSEGERARSSLHWLTPPETPCTYSQVKRTLRCFQSTQTVPGAPGNSQVKTFILSGLSLQTVNAASRRVYTLSISFLCICLNSALPDSR